MALDPFSDEQARTVINLEQRYQGWIEAERTLAALPYDMRFKNVGDYRYLYAIRDRRGNGTSIGRHSLKTEEQLETFRATRADAKGQRDASAERVDESCRLHRTLRLPLVASDAGPILREADRRGLLGHDLLVVGTNAMPAYALEAAGRFRDVPDETEDSTSPGRPPNRATRGSCGTCSRPSTRPSPSTPSASSRRAMPAPMRSSC